MSTCASIPGNITMRSLNDFLETALTSLATHPTTVPLAARLRQLQARLDAGRFHLAVLENDPDFPYRAMFNQGGDGG